MNRLSILRTQYSLTQLQLAKLTNSSRRTIQNIESGKTIPNVVLALKIAKVLNSSVEYLFSDYITETEGVESKNE